MSHAHLSLTDSLLWSQLPKTSPRECILTQHESVVGRLRWQKLWGTLAVGESPVGSWSFKRVGFLSIRVTARAIGSDDDLANFYPSMFGGGRLEMRDGRTWRLQA
jgi:hypothetical protein